MSELSKNLLEENVENVEGDILKEVLARIAVLEDKQREEDEKKVAAARGRKLMPGENPDDFKDYYPKKKGEEGISCPTIDFSYSGSCKAALGGQRWTTLAGWERHIRKVSFVA